jgi:hypothetical protein
MTPQDFDALAQQGYNRIPVVCEVLADLETPLSVYLKLADAPYSYLFESVQGGRSGAATPSSDCPAPPMCGSTAIRSRCGARVR